MVAIPPGGVTLSDRRTQRKRTVEVAAFELAPAPVTLADYAGVLGPVRTRPATAGTGF
ncbi:hypothetical protein GCM10022222_25870 [Amycolatopsis ultiminotia]|uniref:Uncharacterized protein n=1 Tax=Amycolatopsis ultiminotia TaxID=543629 RepID=A0ABP6VXY0_9PSEU